MFMVSLKAIEESKNISIQTDNDSFGDASALYTYILTLHKKVSLVTQEKEIDFVLSCLPWYDKVRKTTSNSSDLKIDLTKNTQPLYRLFKEKGSKINKKMATAFYASCLLRNDYFNRSELLDMSELISLGADNELCNLWLKKSLPLSLFRLKSLLFSSLILYDDAKIAILSVSEDDYKKTGATFKHAEIVMKEVLNIIHVQRVVLIESDNENRLVKII